MVERVQVEPKMLEWACERAGLDSATSADKFPKLQDWIDQKSQPTFKQIQEFAQKTHVPLGMLFLSEPPEEKLPINDFRTIAGTPDRRPSADLLETIYTCQRRQDWYRNYLQSEGIDGAREYVGSASLSEDPTTVADRICQAIEFDRQEGKNWEDVRKLLIDRIENLDILVMVNGIVGNNTRRKLDPDEFRGFALVDPIAPLIFINGSDTKAAQLFTIAHELAHVWLGEGGVSDVSVNNIAMQERVETWCNRVAAEILLPLSELEAEYQPDSDLEKELPRLVKQYKVSTLVVLRRIYDLGKIDRTTFSQSYIFEVRKFELKKLESNQTKGGGGGDFYLTLKVRASGRFSRALVISALEGKTLYRDAFRMLGVSTKDQFDRFSKKLGVD